MSNVLLGSIRANDVGGAVYSGGGVVSLPTDTVVTTPFESFESSRTDVGGPVQEVEWWQRSMSLKDAPKTGDMAQGGSDYTLFKEEDPGFTPPTDDKDDTGTGNKKNLLLFGIGGLVLAYLLFRKK